MDSRVRIKEKVDRDSGSVLVATRSNEIIGTVSMTEDGRIGFIFRLAVADNPQNAGVGIKLMSLAEQELFKRGLKEVNILVDSENAKLQEYYEKRGYEKGHTYCWLTKEQK